MRVTCPTSTATRSRTYGAKPASSIETLYSPGRSVGTRKKPLSLLFTTRAAPVEIDVAVTDAPGTTAPEGSLMTPEILPTGCCPAAVKPDTTMKKQTTTPLIPHLH